MRRPNLSIIGIEERKSSQVKGPVNIFSKSIEENFPNLKKQIPTEHEITQKTYTGASAHTHTHTHTDRQTDRYRYSYRYRYTETD